MPRFELGEEEEIYAEIANVYIIEVKVSLFGNPKFKRNGAPSTMIITNQRVLFLPEEEWKVVTGIGFKALKMATKVVAGRAASSYLDTFLRKEGCDVYGMTELPMTNESCSVCVYNDYEAENGSYVLDMEIIRRKAPDFKNIPYPHVAVNFTSKEDCDAAVNALKRRGIHHASVLYPELFEQ